MTTTMERPIERRLMPAGTCEIRALETTDSLSRMRGQAVPYGVQTDIGFFLEEFARGAFTKSIRESARALPLLLFHDDQAFPIGVAERWDEKDTGLVGEWKLADTEEAQRAAKLAKDGMLTGLSVRFRPIRSSWTFVEDWTPDGGEKDSVIREEAGLSETSLVPIAAYQTAAVEWVRTGEARAHREAVEARELLAWVERMRA